MDGEDFIMVERPVDVSKLHPAGDSPDYLELISEIIEQTADDLWAVNKEIHDNPELGYEEFKAHALLTSFLEKRHGWNVTPSAYGMATAWVAVYDSERKGPVVSFNCEMDALPNIGHACGHNLIATASLAAGLATAEILERHQLPGKVVLFGTPAEEGGGGKIRLLKGGAYTDHGVDISLISHPGITHDGALTLTTAFHRFKIEYFGKATRAATTPWLGVNALDALILAYNSISMLRQQTMPGDMIAGCITDGGATPNVIHDYAAGTFVVRANTAKRLAELQGKVDACTRAGAEATGARKGWAHIQSYLDHVPNRVLAASYARYWNSLNPPSRITLDEETQESVSTDQGNISHALPSISVCFQIPPGPEGGGNHTPDFEKAAGTKEAFERCLRVGKALAGTAVDILTVKGLLVEVKAQWKKDMEAAK